MVSHFMIPPKILTRTPLTCYIREQMRKASVTWSTLAPPPTSRKLAGCAAVQLDEVHRAHRQPRAR